MKPTDIRIRNARVSFADERLRTPLVLATGPIEAVTRARVELTAETRDGRSGQGAGEMILSDAWGFPSTVVNHADRDAAMRIVVERFARALVDHGGFDHPIGLFEDVVNDLDTLRRDVSAELALAETLPRLGALVSASAVDLAAHDAFGKAIGRNSYALLGPDHAPDLGRWLGQAFAGRYLDEFIATDPAPRLPIIHLVGGADALTAADLDADGPADGLPTTLEQWIDRDGVFQFKVKIKGYDLNWDLARIRSVHATAARRLAAGGGPPPVLTVDPNEQCADPGYGVELLGRLRHDDPAAFEALALFEQPTGRDLEHPRHDMRPLAALRPVLIDEGLTDPDGLDLAVELGWSGVAFKVCKGLSSSLLVAARARVLGLVGTVMDLTLPGLAFAHSAGFAARLGGRFGLEANARQYLPHACPEVAERLPGLFLVRNGYVDTSGLRGPGLGA